MREYAFELSALMPPQRLDMGACSLRSQCPHTPASHWQSQMAGPALVLA